MKILDINQIKEMLQSDSLLEIEKAINWIGENRPPDALSLLVPFVRNNNQDVADTAIYCLGEIGDSDSIPILLDIVRNCKDKSLVSTAIFSLQEYNDTRIEEMLLNLLETENLPAKIRRRVVESIKFYPSDRARQILIESLKRNDSLSYEIVDSLYYMNDESIYSNLLELRELYSYDYVDLIIRKAIMEIEFERTQITSLNKIEINPDEEYYSVLQVYQYCLSLNSEKEEFLIDLVLGESLQGIFAFGSLKMKFLISMTFVEKASDEGVIRLKKNIMQKWTTSEQNQFEAMMDENSKLHVRYFRLN